MFEWLLFRENNSDHRHIVHSLINCAHTPNFPILIRKFIDKLLPEDIIYFLFEATRNHHTEIAKLLAQRVNHIDALTIKGAIENRDLELVKFFYDQCPQEFGLEAYKIAKHCCYRPVLEFLESVHPTFKSENIHVDVSTFEQTVNKLLEETGKLHAFSAKEALERGYGWDFASKLILVGDKIVNTDFAQACIRAESERNIMEFLFSQPLEELHLQKLRLLALECGKPIVARFLTELRPTVEGGGRTWRLLHDLPISESSSSDEEDQDDEESDEDEKSEDFSMERVAQVMAPYLRDLGYSQEERDSFIEGYLINNL